MYSHHVLHVMKRTLLGEWSRQNTSFLGALLFLVLKLEHVEGSKPKWEEVLENQRGNESFENITRSLVFWKNSGESQRALRGPPCWEGVENISTPPASPPTHSLSTMDSLKPRMPDGPEGKVRNTAVWDILTWVIFTSPSPGIPSVNLYHRLAFSYHIFVSIVQGQTNLLEKENMVKVAHLLRPS